MITLPIGIDLRFCRNDVMTPEETSIITCDPGEALAIHDVDLTSAGADEVAAVARALFVAIVNTHRDPPDAAQRHEAEQAALTEPDRIA